MARTKRDVISPTRVSQGDAQDGPGMRPYVDAGRIRGQDADHHFLSLNIVAGVQLGRRQRSEPPIQGLGWTGETPIAAAQDRLVTRAAPSRDRRGPRPGSQPRRILLVRALAAEPKVES
jgi:hypothetical protein